MDLFDTPADRRDALRCMAWAGTGALWAMSGGVASSTMLVGKGTRADVVPSFTFLQLSDSHVGFAKPANPDARATLSAAPKFRPRCSYTIRTARSPAGVSLMVRDTYPTQKLFSNDATRCR